MFKIRLTILRKLKECPIPVPSSGDFTFLPEYVALTGKVPPRLVPYIQDIVNDNEALASLSHILAPWQGEEMDEVKRENLELELLRKCNKEIVFLLILIFATKKIPPLKYFKTTVVAQPAPELTISRPNTYVVNSSSAEVGDSEPEEATLKKLHVSSSAEKDEKIIAASSLKASTATHEISTIPSTSTPESILRAQTQSNASVDLTGKPPKLIEILEIEYSNATINSSSLEDKLLSFQISPNGGGSVDNTYNVDLPSPSLSSPSSIQNALNVDNLSLAEIAKGSIPLIEPVGETSRLYEQDSTYVRTIRQLMQSSPPQVPQVTPNSGVTITTRNSHTIPGMEPGYNRLSREEESKIIKLHNGDSVCVPKSSANSETTQLNDMLLGRQYDIESNKNYDEGNDLSKKESPSPTENDENFHQPCYKKELDTSSSSVNVNNSRSPNNTGVDNIVGSQTNQKQFKENEAGSWDTLSTDGEKERSMVSTINTISKKRSSKRSRPPPHPKTKPRIRCPSRNANGAPCHTSICKMKSNPEISASCEPVYTEGYKNTEMPPPTSVKLLESEHSDNENNVTAKQDEVSIAIMYIIEDEEVDGDGDDEDTEGEHEKLKDSCKTSSNGNDLKDDDDKGFNSSKELLPLPKKVLSPIYLTAEKSSAYSIITADETIPPTPTINLPPPPPQNESHRSDDLPSPWAWPQQSRMIPVDQPSNIQLHASADDPDQTLFASCQHSLLGKSITSLQLPPLPEEIMDQFENRNSGGMVPTIFYENETRLSSANKTLSAN